MVLPVHDRIKHLLPGCLYYPHKIAKEARFREPELRILHDIVPAGRPAIDVGANRGYYSYALSKIASRVEAFEPYPATARFARRKLGRNVRLHEVALSNYSGSATLRIPQCKNDIDIHYSATLKDIPIEKYIEVAVRVMTIDQFGFDDVGFIKIDAEGSDIDVIEGARETISRHRPNLLVELLPLYRDPLRCIEQIETTMGYRARIMVGGRLLDARQALGQFSPSLRTFNVVFMPSPDALAMQPHRAS
jgi:FkbM family methyltransferase